MFMMESRYNKVTNSPTFSLNILNFFRAAILQASYKYFFWSLDVFLVFYRKALLCSPSESASNRNSEEQFLKKFLEKVQGSFLVKMQAVWPWPCNFTFNKIFIILALSFSLIDLIGFKFHCLI